MNTSIPCYGIIPARYDSSRFSGKPLADIWGRPMFWHVYAHAQRARVLRKVVLATDDERIKEAALQWEVPCVMTRHDHASGTDRVFEAAAKLGVEPHAVIVNVQGDEPALDPAVIKGLVQPFLDDAVQVSTLAAPISPERAASPNQVKVVTAANGDALYFSRSRIPFDRDGGEGEILGHIGLYAFRMSAFRNRRWNNGKSWSSSAFWKTASPSASSARNATRRTGWTPPKTLSMSGRCWPITRAKSARSERPYRHFNGGPARRRDKTETE